MTNKLTAACAFISAFAWAQPAPPAGKAIPASKVERKGKSPVSKDVLKVKLPKPVQFKLDNGLTVMVLEDHRLPLVSMQLLIDGAGSLYNPPDTPGLAGIAATMLREGAAGKTSKQIAEEMDRLGATFNASAPFGSGNTTINMSGLSDNLPQWLALSADLVLRPSFPADELAKLKQRMKAQLQQQRSSPSFLIQERFNKAVYGDHPASITSPTLAAIDSITSEMLAKWHAARYAPENSILGIAGDVKAADLPELFNALPAWEPTATKLSAPSETKPVAARHVLLVDRPGSVQTDLYLGNIAVNRTDPDYIAMVVMDRIVGSLPASRLFTNLREEKGYTYGAYSQLIARKFAGPWIAYGNMRTDVTAGALTEFLREINRIRDEKVPDAELEESRRSLVARFALSLEQPSELLNYSITQKFYGLPADYWETYPAKIAAVTADDIQRVARKYLNADTLQIVAVGDGSKIKPALEKYGPVEVYTTQGNKL